MVARDKNGKTSVKVEAFTLEDVRQELRERKGERDRGPLDPPATSERQRGNDQRKPADAPPAPRAAAKRGAVSVLDVLGFDPNRRSRCADKQYDRGAVPLKWHGAFDSLVKMRDELLNRVQLHTVETLQQNDVEAADHPNMLGQHVADGAAEQEDLERMMCFVENEQELLREVRAALERIQRGTYGICEQTGEKIDRDRLQAIPFARFSLRGQEEFERARKATVTSIRSGSLFAFEGDDSDPLGGNGDGEE